MNFWASFQILQCLPCWSWSWRTLQSFEKERKRICRGETLCTKSLPASVLAQPFEIHPHPKKQMAKKWGKKKVRAWESEIHRFVKLNKLFACFEYIWLHENPHGLCGLKREEKKYLKTMFSQRVFFFSFSCYLWVTPSHSQSIYDCQSLPMHTNQMNRIKYISLEPGKPVYLISEL